MTEFKIPEAPNTNNEPLQTVEEAALWLARTVAMPFPDRAALSKLGKDCSLAARAMGRPTGTRQVVGKPWPTEKTYTADVLNEAFRLNPTTQSWLELAKQKAASAPVVVVPNAQAAP